MPEGKADGKSESRLGWLAKYGVPSLLLSGAVFVVQQQQQTFDRVQRITADGWLYYSNARTELRFAGDAQRELALLKVIGYAFPNIFCDVRRDMYERAWSAEAFDPVVTGAPAPQPAKTPTPTPTAVALEAANIAALVAALKAPAPDGRQPIQEGQIDALLDGLKIYDTPKRVDQPRNLIEAWFPKKKPERCDDTIGNQKGGATPGGDTKSKETGSGGAASPSPAKDVTSASETAPSASAASPGAGASSGAAVTGDAAAKPAPGSPPPAPVPGSAAGSSRAAVEMEQPALTPTKSEYYVYFHIRDTGRRDASVATDPRVVLAAFNYRVIRGVERIGGGFPNSSEVRFFGEDQRADAEQLAKYLDYQFRGENLRFKAKPIGKDYPNMPPQNIEVWVIDPQP